MMLRRRIMGETETGILPNEYQQVEYLLNTSAAYIDTGYNLNIDELDITFSIDESTQNDMFPCGFKNNTYSTYVEIYRMSQNYCAVQDVKYSNVLLSPNVIYNVEDVINIKMSETQLEIKNITTNVTGVASPNAAQTISTNLNMFVFCWNNAGSPASFLKGKIYNLELYNDGVKVVHLIPCYRKYDQKPGMYDIVRNLFLTSADPLLDFILPS